MLKAVNDQMMILGLNPQELKHLKQGQPLAIQLDDLGYNAKVVIFVGESDQKMKQQLEAVNELRRLMEAFNNVGTAGLDLSKLKVGGH